MSKPKKEQAAAEHEILLKIARKGSGYFYPFHNQGEDYIASRATIYRAKENLEKNQLIKFLETQVVERRERKIYTLTMKGLCEALASSNLLHENPKDIVEIWGHIIPVLKSFSLFEKHGVKRELLDCIQQAVTEILKKYSLPDEMIPSFVKGNVRLMLAEKKIEPKLLADPDSASEYEKELKTQLKFDKVLAEDYKLRQSIKDHLEQKRLRIIMNGLDITARLARIFPLLENDEPDWNEVFSIEKLVHGPRMWKVDELIHAFIETEKERNLKKILETQKNR